MIAMTGMMKRGRRDGAIPIPTGRRGSGRMVEKFMRRHGVRPFDPGPAAKSN